MKSVDTPKSYSHKDQSDDGASLATKVSSAASQERIGIVVRIEKNHSVIWNADDDLVLAVGDAADELDLGSWVRYAAVDIGPGKSPKRNITKEAYTLQKVEPTRLSARSSISVKVQAFLKLHRRPKYNSAGFALAEDDILRCVHIPRDEDLIDRLEAGQTVEVYAVFMENYMKPSHWVAVYMNIGGEGAKEHWIKLTGLNDRVEEIAEAPYTYNASPGDIARMREGFTNQQREERRVNATQSPPLTYWKAPDDYNGPVHETKKTISQVLGLVICHEKEGEVSVVYTRFGLARIEKNLLTGTWLRMKLYEDDPEIPPETTAYLLGTHYLVRNWEKIRPPMSTRVVQLVQGEERLLLCGVIEGADKWSNEYLGRVDDEGGLMKSKAHSAGSYLVEACLFKNKRSHGGLCWRVVKFHGKATPDVNSVPLHLSMVPNQLGRTCDDEQTMDEDAYVSHNASMGSAILDSSK